VREREQANHIDTMNGLIDLGCIWLHIEYQCLMFIDTKTSHMILLLIGLPSNTQTYLSLSLLISIGRACASIENHDDEDQEEARVSEGVVG